MLFSYFSSRVEDHHLPQRHSLSSSHHFFFFFFCLSTFVLLGSRLHAVIIHKPYLYVLILLLFLLQHLQLLQNRFLLELFSFNLRRNQAKASKNLCSFPSSPTKRDILRWMGSTFITCSLKKKNHSDMLHLNSGLAGTINNLSMNIFYLSLQNADLWSRYAHFLALTSSVDRIL